MNNHKLPVTLSFHAIIRMIKGIMGRWCWASFELLLSRLSFIFPFLTPFFLFFLKKEPPVIPTWRYGGLLVVSFCGRLANKWDINLQHLQVAMGKG
jgi:hypothetical protein